MIAGSVDDRTEEERGLKVWHTFLNDNVLMLSQPLKENKYVIPKSRYDSVDLYIAQDPLNRPEYNDSAVPFDSGIFERLRTSGERFFLKEDLRVLRPSQGVDDLLAKHIAHLFIRDPLVLFSELIDQDDTISMDHFEVSPWE